MEITQYDGKIDFSSWKKKMKALLSHKKVALALEKNIEKWPKDKLKKKSEIDEEAYNLIIMNLADNVLRKVDGLETPLVLWGKLESLYTLQPAPNLAFLKGSGGLGIRPLEQWNIALMAYHVCSILSGRDSLWVKWIHTYRLKGRSFWSVKIPWDSSWSWRKLLRMREMLRKHFVVKLGDGRSTFLWYDSWHPLGALDEIVPTNFFYDSELDQQARVSDVLVNGQWTWPDCPREAYLQIISQGSPASSNPPHDVVMWRSSDGKLLNYSSRHSWHDLGPTGNMAPWSSIVWTGTCIPKHSFILWLAIKGKLVTQDRMQAWTRSEDLRCAFYDG
ncbi:uncharacterized protein LOC116105039 [Pistacia vera]|uniref:uncharacterized protein LOC116105039 n=1 Tax=Pistacia vera TaxID=55513 RepID=UPI001263A68C|nr:uncharacterized protein LOC116105039 [Pistacia vera]